MQVVSKLRQANDNRPCMVWRGFVPKQEPRTHPDCSAYNVGRRAFEQGFSGKLPYGIGKVLRIFHPLIQLRSRGEQFNRGQPAAKLP